MIIVFDLQIKYLDYSFPSSFLMGIWFILFGRPFILFFPYCRVAILGIRIRIMEILDNMIRNNEAVLFTILLLQILRYALLIVFVLIVVIVDAVLADPFLWLYLF